MKRVISFCFAVWLMLGLCFSAAAEELFDRSYTRFNDYADTVTEEEEKQLNDKVRPMTETLQMDFPVCVFLTRKSTSTLSEFAADFYERNLFGCGEDKSGIMLVLDLQNAKYDIYYFGEAENLIGEPARQKLSDTFKANCHDDALSYYDVFDRYYDDVFAMVEDARTHPTTAPANASDASDPSSMPDWYPENTDGFHDFHGEDLPPVVDDAHIFTDEQFKTLSSKISEMNARLGIGYAAFTSYNNHGMLPEEYSSDFLHFNGYGVGEEYGAVVFYLSLDPEDRCWLTTSINSYEKLFTFDVTYEIDEMVDSSIRGGDYYEAFLMHADYVDAMFSVMSENLPEWYPEGTKTYDIDRENRAYSDAIDFDAPRIVDNAAVLSDEQFRTFSDMLRRFSEQYNLDLVIFTDSVDRAPKSSQYAQDFYYYNHYASDGICLYFFDTGKNNFGVQYYGKGEQYEKLSLDSELRSKFNDHPTDEAIAKYLELLAFMLEKDRLPMHAGTAILCFVFGLAGGLIAAGIVTGKMKRAMKITQPDSTYFYMADGSFHLHGTSRHFLYSTVTRTAKPKPSDSSSGSSGGSSRGGSTYTSGRSAGGSYSSGGRRF